MAHARPLIGVTTSEVRRPENIHHLPEGEPPQPEMALGMPYVRALARAGAIPVVLPPLEVGVVPELLGSLAGLCLSGGPDIDPAAYGADREPELGPTEPTLDAFELAVARHADEAGLPILGICRGCQALNVARGGSLVQHVGGHRQTEPGWQGTHDVTVDGASRLGAIVGEALRVNSFHHQAVERLGSGLRAVAWSGDGLVEGIEEEEGERLVLGVQWHAETLESMDALFGALVRAAAERAPVV